MKVHHILFPLLPVNLVTSSKHKSQNIAIWWMRQHLDEQTVPDKSLFSFFFFFFRDRFLTCRLLKKWSAGFSRLDISFANETQLLHTVLCSQNLVSAPRTFTIDKTNTTSKNLSCFVSFFNVFWVSIEPFRLGYYLWGQLFSHQRPRNSDPKFTEVSASLPAGSELTFHEGWPWCFSFLLSMCSGQPWTDYPEALYKNQ